MRLHTSHVEHPTVVVRLQIGRTDGTALSVSELVIVVVSSSHQSPSLGVSLFRSALNITILLSMWSSLKGSRKGGVCHEANDHSCGNGCAL